jgi:ATP-dependent Clp protease ATP-binding subunit ClpC
MKRKREIVKKVKIIMNLAQQEGKDNGDRELKLEHIVLAILNEDTNKSNLILKHMGFDVLSLYDLVSEHLRHSQLNVNLNVNKKLRLPHDINSTKIMKELDAESEHMGDMYIDTTHIMLALLKEKNLPLVKLLNKNKLSYNNFKKGIINYYNANSKELTDYEKEKIKDMEKQNKENLDNNPIKNSLPFDDDDKNEFTNSGKMKNNRKESTKTPVLDNFCRDISKMAEDNELDPVVGRGIEIKRVSQILARRKKNNPILIGDPGVGKCVTSDTQVVMRDDTTGELFKITISDLLKSIN